MSNARHHTVAIMLTLVLLSLGGAVGSAEAGPDVTVVNPPSSPVPTRDVDNPAQQPFQRGVFTSTLNKPVPVFTVPAGKRLVIEFLSAEAAVPLGETMSRFFVSVQDPALPLGEVRFTHFIPPLSHGPSAGEELWIAAQPLRLYVDAGDEVVVNAVGDATGGAFISLSGYLVNAP